MFDEIMERLFGRKKESSEKSKMLLYNRAIGESLPVSIGTSLIVDGPKADPSRWNQVVLINLLTLSRNIIQAVPAANQFDLRSDDVTEVVLTEMDILRQSLNTYSPGVQVEFYLPDYKLIYIDFPMAKPRLFNTKNKQFVQQMMLDVRAKLKELIEEENKKRDERKQEPLPIRIMRGWKLDKDKRKTTVLTSFPTDLLSQYQFPALTLLESHTGAVKSRREWNTKLNWHKKEDIVNMPFMKFTLQVFGDDVFFIQQNLKVKQWVVDMSKRDRWTPITTESTIRGSIGKVKHMADREALLKFL